MTEIRKSTSAVPLQTALATAKEDIQALANRNMYPALKKSIKTPGEHKIAVSLVNENLHQRFSDTDSSVEQKPSGTVPVLKSIIPSEQPVPEES